MEGRRDSKRSTCSFTALDQLRIMMPWVLLVITTRVKTWGRGRGSSKRPISVEKPPSCQSRALGAQGLACLATTPKLYTSDSAVGLPPRRTSGAAWNAW